MVRSESRWRGLVGTLTLRLKVMPDGQIEGGQILYDRLLAAASDAADPKTAIAETIGLLRPVRFPPAKGESAVTFAIPFGRAIGS